MELPAIESTGKDRHQTGGVSSQLCLKTLLGSGFQHNKFDTKVMTKLKDQISSKAKESTLMTDNEVTELPLKDEPQKFF
jgi:hypothetical protein